MSETRKALRLIWMAETNYSVSRKSSPRSEKLCLRPKLDASGNVERKRTSFSIVVTRQLFFEHCGNENSSSRQHFRREIRLPKSHPPTTRPPSNTPGMFKRWFWCQNLHSCDGRESCFPKHFGSENLIIETTFSTENKTSRKSSNDNQDHPETHLECPGVILQLKLWVARHLKFIISRTSCERKNIT